MNKFDFYNPVYIEFGQGKFNSITDLIKNRRTLLITCPVFNETGLVSKIKSKLNTNLIDIIDNVGTNPDFKYLDEIYKFAHKKYFEVILAVGGGSVVDSAKVISVYDNTKSFASVERFIKNDAPENKFMKIPYIGVATTAGTGSELTPWATVWDKEEKKKYSLHLPFLWAESCIYDSELTLTLPRDLTIYTALDALSHSLEVIWNKNANPISTNMAIRGAKIILKTLLPLVNDLNDITLRDRMLLSSLYAGLAFSNTQTAIAHAISYYITAHKDVPHGLACSFTLPDIIDTVCSENSKVYNILTAIFTRPIPNNILRVIFTEPISKTLRELFKELNISTNIYDYGITDDDLNVLKKGLISNKRAGNSLVNVKKLFETIEKKYRRS